MIRLIDFKTKQLTSPDEDGEIDFAIKATIQNDSDDDDIFVTFQGLDEDGFVVHEIICNINIPIGTSRTITQKEDYVSYELYSDIVEWQIT